MNDIKYQIIFPLIFLLAFSTALSQDTLQFQLRITSGKRIRSFNKRSDISIYTGDTASVSGNFLYKTKTTIVLKPYYQTFPNADLKFYAPNTDSIISIDQNTISYLRLNRNTVPAIAAVSFWGFVGTALVISPLISIKKSGFQTTKFLKTTGFSLAGALISAATVALTMERRFFLKSNDRKRRIWTIEN